MNQYKTLLLDILDANKAICTKDTTGFYRFSLYNYNLQYTKTESIMLYKTGITDNNKIKIPNPFNVLTNVHLLLGNVLASSRYLTPFDHTFDELFLLDENSIISNYNIIYDAIHLEDDIAIYKFLIRSLR